MDSFLPVPREETNTFKGLLSKGITKIIESLIIFNPLAVTHSQQYGMDGGKEFKVLALANHIVLLLFSFYMKI